MKKIILVAAVLMAIALTACTAEPVSAELTPSPYSDVEETGEIKMTLEKEEITSDNHTVHLFLENLSDRSCTFGEGLQLEKKTDDGWMVMPEETHMDRNNTDYQVSPGGKWDQTVELADAYGPLHPGSYRIIKEIWQKAGSAGKDVSAEKERILVQAEFQVI